MDTMRPLVSPILVGRDDLLAHADRRVLEVQGGHGIFLLIAGEAGLGKTRLLGAIERRATAAGFAAARGGAYPSDLRVPGAVLVDLGRAMTRSTKAALGRAGVRLLETLDALDQTADVVAAADEADRTPSADRAATPAGDAHRRRRLLILDAADALLEAAADGPVILELEDLHWSDDLTLEILDAVARRVPQLPLLLVGTYRSDELIPRAPMRQWRARLVSQRLAEEVRLQRLTPSDTATMLSVLLGSDLPAPRDLVDTIQARTDGIPFHIEELFGLLVASGQWDPATGPAALTDIVLEAAVPETVEEAIVARLDQRSASARAVAEAGAVVGRSFDLDLLAAVLDQPVEALSDPLTELADHYLLLPSAAPGRYGFRHPLICDAIYAHVPEPHRRRLHGRTADAARDRPELGGDPFLAIHYEGAGRADEAYQAALAGARRALALSSYGEARALFETARRTAPSRLAPLERGALEEAYAGTAAATDDNVTADKAYTRARKAYLEGGHTVEAAAVLARHAPVRHLLGDALDTRTARLQAGLTDLATAPSSPASEQARARLLAAMAAALMLDRRLDGSIAFAASALEAARRADDAAIARNASTTLGACYVFAGRMDEGWSLLNAAIADATGAQLEAEAARAYRMLGSSASVLVEYDRAETVLREGIADAERVQLWNDRHYMAAHLGHVLWATGRWDDAEDVARHALADGRGGITTRITALHVLGYVALGRGDLDGARGHLDEARKLGERMRELQRLSPALWGLAEVALAAGDPATAAERSDRAASASAAVADAAYLFPFAVTGTRALLALGETELARRWVDRVAKPIEARAIPGTLPAIDHARGLVALTEGSTGVARTALTAAVAGWNDRGRAWEGAWGRLDLARSYAQANQPSEARRSAAMARAHGERLGAPAVLAAADEILGSGRGRASEAPWAPLTAREFDVARRVARGRTNPQIAEDLGISRKTVSAHIEHILAKLGVDRRTEIAAWTAARPVLHSGAHGEDREE